MLSGVEICGHNIPNSVTQWLIQLAARSEDEPEGLVTKLRSPKPLPNPEDFVRLTYKLTVSCRLWAYYVRHVIS